MCAGAALLLMVAGFISGGGVARVSQSVAMHGVTPGALTASIFPCSWFDDCPVNPGTWQTDFTPASQTITQGQSTTLYYTAYSCGPNGCSGECYYTAPSTVFARGGASPICDINPDAPNTNYTSGVVVNNPSLRLGVGTGATAYTVTPSRTTTYYFCAKRPQWVTSTGCKAVTVIVNPPQPPPVSAPAPTVSIDAGAGPGVTRTVAVGTPVTVSGSYAAGSGDTITQTSLVDYQSNALPGVSTGVPPINKSYVFTPATPGSYIFYPSVTTSSYPSWNNYGKSVTVVVTAAGPCNDIPAQRAVPSGCVNPVPSPGSCIPGGGSYSSASNTCMCPRGTHLSGSACAANPLCSNGLNDSYAPSCTCPSGKYQPLGGSACVPLPVCANGLNQSYSPSCTCPSGQVQVSGGTTCVLQGSILSFTANPIRVLKGNTATISWSTSHMSACSLGSFTALGTATLSSQLSSTLAPIINSKTVFTLHCTDAAGEDYTSSVTVNLIPQTIEQ